LEEKYKFPRWGECAARCWPFGTSKYHFQEVVSPLSENLESRKSAMIQTADLKGCGILSFSFACCILNPFSLILLQPTILS